MVKVTTPLSAGVAVSTVFVTATSASGTLTVALSALSVLSGSNVVAEAIAVLVIGVTAVTVATMSSVADAPLARVPTVHTSAAYAPADGDADTKVNPPGNASATDTPAAGSGPLLATVMVNVTLAPSAGPAVLTLLVRTRSARRPLSEADAALLPGMGSCVAVAAVAVFVIVPVDVTVAVIASVAAAPLASVPTVQTPEA